MESPEQNVDMLEEDTKMINKELLELAIRSKEGRNDIFVKDFTVKSGSLKGENFASLTFRVSATIVLHGNDRVYHLFIKLIPTNPVMKKHILENKIFHKEGMTYSQIIPDMVKFQKERGVEPFGPSVPDFFYSWMGETDGIIILEDLGHQGYTLPDKASGLTFEQGKIVVKQLAQFHSLSHAIKTRDGNAMNAYEHLFVESFFPSSFVHIMKHFLNSNLEVVKFLSDDPKVKECVRKIQCLELEKTMNGLLEPEEPFALICHGDMWCNNILFKYEDEKDKTNSLDAKLLDWQMVRYSSPVTDLVFLYFSSMTRITRAKHMAELNRLYYCTFMDSLKEFNLSFDEFTYDVMEKQLKEKMLFGVLRACIVLPAILSKSIGIADFKGTTDTDVKEFAEKIGSELLKSHYNVIILKERLLGVVEDAVEMNLI